MEHKYIDEFDLVERFLTGRLAAEESAEFAEHFVACAECLDRLETTKAFIEGLRTIVSDQVTEPHRYHSRGLLRRLAIAMPRKPFAVAASIVVLVALLGLIIYFQLNRSRIEAYQAKSAAAQWQNRYEEEHQSSSLADKKHQESERELSGQVAQLRGQLEDERKQKLTDLGTEHRGPIRPEINPGILVLNSVRGRAPSPDSTNELTLPRSAESFMISLRLEGEGGYKDYRMTIFDDHSHLVWKHSGLKPNNRNSLWVRFPSSLFRRSDYLLTVEGVAADGQMSVVGEYSFRVLRVD